MKLMSPSMGAAVSVLVFAHSSQAAVIGFWDFNNYPVAPNKTVQVVHLANLGNGTLYQQRADTSSNGKAGGAFVDAANGINAAAGRALAWDDVAKAGQNDGEFFVTFSTAGLQNINVSFDLRGNALGGIASYDLKYSLVPLVDVTNPIDVIGTIKDFDMGISNSLLNNQLVGNPLGLTRFSFDLSTLTSGAVDNQGFVAIRLDDFQANDALSIDNLLITGVVPEPSTALLGGLGLLGLLRRKR
jgi:PEP-CTERM motif